MVETRGSGRDFFQVDNAYFGRNIYFRVTQNALQINYLPSKVIDNRYKFILNHFLDFFLSTYFLDLISTLCKAINI
jgi:hypothetical protein